MVYKITNLLVYEQQTTLILSLFPIYSVILQLQYTQNNYYSLLIYSYDQKF